MENTLQNSRESSNLEDYMIQKRIEIMMDMANKKVVGELNKINGMVNKMNEEIAYIKKQISEGRHLLNTKPVTAAEIAENKKSQESVGSANKEEASKPRYGDYKPEDVKIDKFFYFGNKQ